MPRSFQEIVDEISLRTWRLGGTLLLSPKDHMVIDGAKVNGFFDEVPEIPTIAVSMGHTETHSLGTLLHEYCHFTQFIEKCHAWQVADKYSHKCHISWTKGKNYSNMDVAIAATQFMEADNERRTVRLIQELDAPLDIEAYARQANAYLHFHNVMLDCRKWYKYPGALYLPEITSLCNPTIDKNFDKTPKKLYNAIVKHAIDS